ncbi:carboxypeptidase regulatory-like domain-containing protein [Horticoccus sp. 23ND18S-11]|uniref:carboxypeptidase regulatory-like domain-containing protein n=1 Tax=Horticoccus sp. 23ND18S-11 TaxID=3391832 RepID=UPI0039C947B5
MRSPFRLSACLLVLAVCASLAGRAAETADVPRFFDLPAAGAETALRQFAVQSGLEVLFAADIAAGVTTREVRGRLPPSQAIARLLEGTPLAVATGTKSGVLRIVRVPHPNARGPAAPEPPPSSRVSVDPDPMMKTKNPLRLFGAWLAVVLAPAASVHAAQGVPTGTIEGRVTNATSGEFVERARLTVDGTALETFTDEGGHFRFAGVPAGSARVTAFYTGLAQQSATVVVAAGRTAQLDLTLTARGGDAGTVKLDAFVVATSKEMSASALAINEQRFAPNIKNVLATDEFGFVAEGNAADFLKFLPGITVEDSGGNARSISINGVPSANVPITVGGFSLASAGVGDTNTGRSVAMDMVSINNLARIEVEYSPTPESMGDALAGTVNMVPRSAFERARPVLNASAFVIMRSGEHDFDKTPGPRLTPSRKVDPGFDFSYVAPVNRNFGFTLSGGSATNFSPEPMTQTVWRGASAATGGNFPATTPDQPYLTSFTYRDGTKVTTRNSLGATLDFKLSRYDQLSLGYQFSYFHLYASNQVLTFAMNRVLPGEFSVASTRSAPGQGELQLSNLVRDRHNRTHTPTLIWRHTGPVWKGDVGLGYSTSSNRNRDIDKGLFFSTTGLRRNVTITFDGMQAVRPDRITVVDAATGTVIDPYAITGKTFDAANAIQNNTSDVQRTAYGNVARDFYGSVPLRLKTGFHVHQSARDNRNRNSAWTYLGADGNAATLESAGPFLDPVYSARRGVFGLPPIQGIGNALAWRQYVANPAQFSLNANNDYRSIVTSSKHAEELISGAYLRGDASFFSRRLKLVGGVRAEQTNIDAEGPLTDPSRNFRLNAQGQRVAIVGNTNSLEYSQLTFIERGTRAEKEYLRWFPSLNASFNLRDNLIARAAVYRSVGRPDFNQYAGGVTLPDPESIPSTASRIVVNNVGIKAWSADTLNVRLEYYFAGVGQLSLNAFRREFTNFFGSTRSAATPAFLSLYDLDPDLYGKFDVETQYNVPGTVRMEGTSLNYKQAITFLPDWARGIQVFGNVSTQRRTGALVGNAGFNFFPRSGSWGVSFTRERFSVRGNWNYRSARQGAAVAGVGLPSDNYTWVPKRVTLDAQAEFTFARRYAVFASMRNLTAEPEETQIYNSLTPAPARFRNQIDYGALWTFGIKGTF